MNVEIYWKYCCMLQ